MNTFADDTTLYCTLARMLYDRLRKRLGSDVADKALNPFGMVLPYEQRSAAVDSLFARIGSSGSPEWYLADRLGSVRDVMNNSGTVLDHIDYGGFGVVTNETSPSNGDRYKFTGREYDSELHNLAYYRARYYRADVGLWQSEDPIRFAAGDSNLYRYVANNATNATDPSGLDVLDGLFGGFGSVGLGAALSGEDLVTPGAPITLTPDPAANPAAVGMMLGFLGSSNPGYRDWALQVLQHLNAGHNIMTAGGPGNVSAMPVGAGLGGAIVWQPQQGPGDIRSAALGMFLGLAGNQHRPEMALWGRGGAILIAQGAPLNQIVAQIGPMPLPQPQAIRYVLHIFVPIFIVGGVGVNVSWGTGGLGIQVGGGVGVSAVGPPIVVSFTVHPGATHTQGIGVFGSYDVNVIGAVHGGGSVGVPWGGGAPVIEESHGFGVGAPPGGSLMGGFQIL